MKLKDFSGIRNNGKLPNPKDVQIPGENSEFLDDFATSTTLMLDELEAAALDCESQSKRKESTAAARRILHSIKGEAGILGIDDIYEFCHQAEFAMEELADDEHTDMLLRVKDWLNAAIQHLTGVAIGVTQDDINECKPENRSGMKTLIVEDDFACRKALQIFLSKYGDCFIAVNGCEAVEAVQEALDEGQPYDLICLDIMMPEMDGHEALQAIRKMENERGINGLDGVKVIMVTVKNDFENIMEAFRASCEAYVVKPVREEILLEEIKKLGLIE
ncbi:MAG TPA: response regulator [Phycisphaerales bacterium]|nr:response regulator [Phycisphaerales bacterium]